MRLAAYIKNENLPSFNINSVVSGNPGIGGTEYMFMILLYELSLDTDYDVTIYSNKIIEHDNSITNIIVKDYAEAIQHAVENDIEYFILRNCIPNIMEKYRHRLNTKFVVWCHNYIDYDEACEISDNQNIVANVFVSRQMYDRYIDHDVIKKSTYIYNFINTDYETKKTKKKPIVMYNGSLVPGKGFHVLARVWPGIVREIPDAQLYVMGTGNLYNRKEKLGDLGITTKEYEKQILELLGDSITSVKFLGLVDKNKNELISEAKVGVVNPTAGTETFCISAVDFENCAVPVVTRGKNGLLDVVVNNSTGLLIYNDYQLRKAICKLLHNDELCNVLGANAKQYVKKNFGIEENVARWKNLFNHIQTQADLEYICPENHFQNNLKWLKVINRKLRIVFRLSNSFSSLHYKALITKVIRKHD